MPDKKTGLWIVLGILAGIAILMLLFLFNEKKVNWEEHYKTTSTDPYGLYLIKELIADAYKDNIEDIKKPLNEVLPLSDTSTGNNNIIFIGNSLNLDDRDQKAFYTFIEKGNNAFVSINQLPYSIQYLLQMGGTFTFDSSHAIIYPEGLSIVPIENESQLEEIVDSISSLPEESDSIPTVLYEEEGNDAIYTPADSVYADTLAASPDTAYATVSGVSGLTPVSFTQATIKTTLKAPLPDTNRTFTFKTGKTTFLNFELPYTWHLFSSAGKLHESCSRLATVHDSMYNFISIPYGKGTLYIHTSPVLFSNFHAKEKEGFIYIKDVLSVLSDGKVYWNEVRASQGSPGNGGSNNTPKAYLKYILSFEALRWAWYVFLATTLIYIVFTAKRKQPVIPVIEPVVNTSLEYAHTAGRLYAQIGNHRKLIQLNMRIFLSGIQQKYGVPVNLSDPVSREWLANKSGIPVTYFAELDNLYKKFNVPGHDVKTTDLHTFYQQMQFIYKKIQN